MDEGELFSEINTNQFLFADDGGQRAWARRQKGDGGIKGRGSAYFYFSTNVLFFQEGI